MPDTHRSKLQMMTAKSTKKKKHPPQDFEPDDPNIANLYADVPDYSPYDKT